MNEAIKFSVLVPVYKVEKYIDECIQSVLKQSYPNFELILVDDGSPDRCGEICDSYAAKDGRIRVIHKENGGLMSARRCAIENALGDYYTFIDSDDYVAADMLEVLAGNIARFNADCIIFGIDWVRPDGVEHYSCHESHINRLITDKREALNIILNDSSYNSLCRKCVRAACFDGRDLSHLFHISSGEDKLQTLEILENAGSFLFIENQLYFYRANMSSITHSISYDNYKADFTVEEQVFATLEKLGVFSEADYTRMRNFELNYLVVELKRLSRFCSDKAHSIAGMQSIWQHSYYRSFLSSGYKKAPALRGVIESRGIRRLMNRITFFLFRHRLFSLTVFFTKYIYR